MKTDIQKEIDRLVKLPKLNLATTIIMLRQNIAVQKFIMEGDKKRLEYYRFG